MKPMGIMLLCSGLLGTIPGRLFATTLESDSEQQQSARCSGVVKDTHGEPLAGVSIRVKGSTGKAGTLTGLNGNFALPQAVKGETLQISFIGFVTQYVVWNGQPLDITLKEDVKSLDELVVVGYGSQKKENLTGAVVQLSGETLENRPVTNVSQALQGTVANLNVSSSSGGGPGTAPSINVRGYTGLGTSQSPLVVIDGVPGGDLNSINVNDVESISVLKDAASAAIYGSSAPYGVIIVNTKKGKKQSKATISYTNNIGIAQPINLPHMANSLVFANLYNEAADNAKITRPFTEENLQRIKDYQSGKMKDETIADPAGTDNWLTWYGNGNNDWFDIWFKKTSITQQHTISASGGTDNTNYYIGAGYLQKDGMWNYGDDVYKRYNLRVNVTTQLTKWLSFSVRSAFARTNLDSPDSYASKTGGNYMHQISRKWPTAPLRNPNGEYSYPSDIRLQLEGGRYKVTNDRVDLTGEFVITPLAGWNITANYTYNGTYSNSSDHVKTLYITNPSGSKSIYDGTTPNSFSRNSSKSQHYVVNAFTSYEKQLKDHYFKVMVGFTQELYDNLSLYGSNQFLYTDDLPALSLTYGKSPSLSDDASQLAIRAGFGRINYNYQGKYLVELNGRYDGTSRFLKDVRFHFYPGVSAAWVISKENFWSGLQPYVNQLKFRVSYGSLGDQSFTGSYYPFYPSMGTTAPTSSNWIFPNGRAAYVTNPGLINSALTWVTTNTLDFGFDLGLFDNRLNIEFDWYKRSAKDYVGPAEVLPSIMGASSPQMNNSALETKGFELTIGWKHTIRDWNYGVSFVLSDYTGRVTEYPNPTGLNTTWYKGRKMGEIWGYETVGLFQSEDEIAKAPSQSKIDSRWKPGDVRYKDLNGDNVIDWGDNTLENPGDKRVIGNTTPRFSYGATFNAGWKGIDFSLFLQGIGKRDAWVSSNMFWGITGNQWQSSVLTIHENRWTPDNPDGYFPNYYLSDEASKNMLVQTRYLQDASYMRIKNMQLGYTFPKSLISKIQLDNVRVYFSVDNLATFTNMVKTIDPEFAGSDGKVYPLQRTWSFGINLTF